MALAFVLTRVMHLLQGGQVKRCPLVDPDSSVLHVSHQLTSEKRTSHWAKKLAPREQKSSIG